MEDTKKTNEAAKSEERVERAPLTDEELDEATGGVVGYVVGTVIGNSSTQTGPNKGAVQLMGEKIHSRSPQ